MATAIAQGTSRVTLLVEVVGSISTFRSVGEEGGDLDRYYSTGHGARAGILLRGAIGQRSAVRFGLGAGWRAFGSVSHEFRVPPTGTSMMVIARDQHTIIHCMHLPVLFEWHPVKPLRLLAGMQVLAEVGRTTRHELGEPQFVQFKSGPMEWLVGAELWPMRRLAVGFRHLWQPRPVRVQDRWTPEGVFQRTTWWRTMEAGLAFVLAHADRRARQA